MELTTRNCSEKLERAYTFGRASTSNHHHWNLFGLARKAIHNARMQIEISRKVAEIHAWSLKARSLGYPSVGLYLRTAANCHPIVVEMLRGRQRFHTGPTGVLYPSVATVSCTAAEKDAWEAAARPQSVPAFVRACAELEGVPRYQTPHVGRGKGQLICKVTCTPPEFKRWEEFAGKRGRSVPNWLRWIANEKVGLPTPPGRAPRGGSLFSCTVSHTTAERDRWRSAAKVAGYRTVSAWLRGLANGQVA